MGEVNPNIGLEGPLHGQEQARALAVVHIMTTRFAIAALFALLAAPLSAGASPPAVGQIEPSASIEPLSVAVEPTGTSVAPTAPAAEAELVGRQQAATNKPADMPPLEGARRSLRLELRPFEGGIVLAR